MSHVLWNPGSGSLCWVGFGGDRCDAGQRRVILAFPCIRSCRGGCMWQSGDLIQVTVAVPSPCVSPPRGYDYCSSSPHAHFPCEFVKNDQTRLRKTVVVLHTHSHISIGIKLKIMTSLLLCCQASCQSLTLHHLGWRQP